MHCNGCARRVEKHISKIQGVESWKVDMERETVVVTGDVFPFEVMQCISKVKSVEILEPQV
uniref:HMA domain-containing protein n=2 Tax=Cucumis sativus TaxID=3659 RepID=A0A0A0LFW6_CUCSA